MNFNIIIGWSIVALAITGLIVFIRLRKKGSERKNIEPLLLYAKENNAEISNFDAWDKTLIGIDNKEINTLFFIRNIPGNETRVKITLSEVSGCRIFNTERKMKYNDTTVSLIDRIELIFSFNNHREELSLEFYNSNYDHLTLTGELQLAQKWTGNLKTIINANKELNATEKEKEIINQVIVKSKVGNVEKTKNENNNKTPEKEYSH